MLSLNTVWFNTASPSARWWNQIWQTQTISNSYGRRFFFSCFFERATMKSKSWNNTWQTEGNSIMPVVNTITFLCNKSSPRPQNLGHAMMCLSTQEARTAPQLQTQSWWWEGGKRPTTATRLKRWRAERMRSKQICKVFCLQAQFTQTTETYNLRGAQSWRGSVWGREELRNTYLWHDIWISVPISSVQTYRWNWQQKKQKKQMLLKRHWNISSPVCVNQRRYFKPKYIFLTLILYFMYPKLGVFQQRYLTIRLDFDYGRFNSSIIMIVDLIQLLVPRFFDYRDF